MPSATAQERRDPVARESRDRLGDWLQLPPADLGQLAREPVLALATLVDAAWFASDTARELNLANRELQDMADRLSQLALRDPLTGIANRRALDERLAIEWDRSVRYSRPLSVVMLDVDRLKAVNDDHGHQAGDALLQAVAAELAANVRSGDLVGRLGGDEFLVICPEIDAEAAALVAEKLVESVDRLHLPELPAIGLSVSAGWSSAVGATDTAELMRAADRGMYAAKFGRRD